MKLELSEKAFKDRAYWREKNNLKIINKIKELLKDIQKHPFTGLGKPEPLKGDYSGFWSRRIDQEHRLVYTIDEEYIIIAQCRFYY